MLSISFALEPVCIYMYILHIYAYVYEEEILSEENSHCNYTFPMYLAPNGI